MDNHESLERLARIEQKLDDVKDRVFEHDERTRGLFTNHDNRISSLEKWRSWAIGVWATIAFVTATLLDLIPPKH